MEHESVPEALIQISNDKGCDKWLLATSLFVSSYSSVNDIGVLLGPVAKGQLLRHLRDKLYYDFSFECSDGASLASLNVKCKQFLF